MSEDSKVGVLLRGSSVGVCLVVLNQRCCGSGQYNLPDRMLRLDANTTLNQSYVLFITFVNVTYQSRDQYLPSIHSWDSSPCQVLYIQFLCVCVFFNCFSCSACILQMCIQPNQFPIQIKVYFFIIIYSFIFYLFLFWLSNFSHVKRLRLVDYFACLFCFLRGNCRVIIHNFITFLLFPKDLQCSSFISILT